MNALRELHWLPNRARIEYKILCLIFKCVNCTGPGYLEDLICRNNGSGKGLRSDEKHKMLIVPWVSKQTFAVRSFSVYSPITWNNLPDNLRIHTSIHSFKKELKTHLFN